MKKAWHSFWYVWHNAHVKSAIDTREWEKHYDKREKHRKCLSA